MRLPSNLVAAALFGAAASLCAATDTPSPTLTITQTVTFSDTPTASPSLTDTPVPLSGTATSTPTPAGPITPTPTPPATAGPTETPTPAPTATPTPVLTPTDTPLPQDPGGGTYAYPNPAPDDSVNIVFTMDGPGEARLRVFQSAGEPAAELKEHYASGGIKVLAVPLDGFARGVFIYKVDFKYDDGRRDKRPLKKFVRSAR